MAPRRIVTSEDEEDQAPPAKVLTAPRIIPASARTPTVKAPPSIKPIASTSRTPIDSQEEEHSSELSQLEEEVSEDEDFSEESSEELSDNDEDEYQEEDELEDDMDESPAPIKRTTEIEPLAEDTEEAMDDQSSSEGLGGDAHASDTDYTDSGSALTPLPVKGKAKATTQISPTIKIKLKVNEPTKNLKPPVPPALNRVRQSARPTRAAAVPKVKKSSKRARSEAGAFFFCNILDFAKCRIPSRG